MQIKFITASMVALGLLLGAVSGASAQARDWRPASPAVTAPSAEAVQAAREVVALTTEGVLSEFVATTTRDNWPSVERFLRSKNPSLDAGTLAELRREFERMLVDAAKRDAGDSVAMYARNFTVDELRDLAEFYRSPTGRKSLVTLPLINAEMSRNFTRNLPAMTAAATERFSEILRRRGFAAMR